MTAHSATHTRGIGLFGAGVAGVISILHSVNVGAQTQSTDRASSEGGVLAEVTVTAQKRTENLQEVPVAITALTGATMEALHVQDLKDVTATIPNVQIQVNAGLATAASFVIRGIGIVGNPSPYVGTEVGTVVDGVVQSVNELGLVDRFDVERIEVLRGPQGTLFGANTTGGVINIITRQPTGEYGVYGQVGAGNYDSRSIAAAVNFPITDELAGKVMVANRSREGYYTNLYNGEDIGGINSTAARAYLRWAPSETTKMTLQLDAQQTRNGTDVLLNISNPGQIFYRPDTPYDFKLYSDVPDKHDSDTYGATLTAEWDSGIGEMTSITNVAKWSSRGYQDIDGIDLYGYAQVGNTRGWQASQELRTVIRPRDDLEVLFGLYAQRWHYDSDGQAWVAFVSEQLIDVTLAEQNTNNFAAFSQLYWDLSDRMRLQVGLRASHEEVEMGRENIAFLQPAGTDPFKGYGNLVGAIRQPGDPNNPYASGKESWSNIGGKIGLDYRLNDTQMLYGYYARGFKSGGFNGRISRAEDIGPFDPEYVDSIELGVKSDMLDDRLRVNVALFYNLWQDMQVTDVLLRRAGAALADRQRGESQNPRRGSRKPDGGQRPVPHRRQPGLSARGLRGFQNRRRHAGVRRPGAAVRTEVQRLFDGHVHLPVRGRREQCGAAGFAQWRALGQLHAGAERAAGQGHVVERQSFVEPGRRTVDAVAVGTQSAG